MNRPKVLLPLLALGFVLLATPAYAHAIGDRYDLPLPLGFFALGGAAAVVFSFAVVGVLVRGESRIVGYPRFNLFQCRWIQVVVSGPFLWPAKILSLFLLWLVVATALFGTTRAVDNFAPTFIWVIWWVGMGFFVALFGNLWALANPWKIIFIWAENLFQLACPGQSLYLGFKYPQRWGIWPAVILFFAFAWSENAFSESASPRGLAGMVIVYTTITWVGMFVFGKQQWLRHGEVFSVVLDSSPVSPSPKSECQIRENVGIVPPKTAGVRTASASIATNASSTPNSASLTCARWRWDWATPWR